MYFNKKSKLFKKNLKKGIEIFTVLVYISLGRQNIRRGL